MSVLGLVSVNVDGNLFRRCPGERLSPGFLIFLLLFCLSETVFAASSQPQSFDAFLSDPGQPVLRILYAANSHGALHPCPSWGHTLVGGVARRATILDRYRREPVPTLSIVGAEEFAPDTELPDPAKTGDASPQTVRAVYDALRVDCGVLSPEAAAWFGKARPVAFVEMADKPITRRFNLGGCAVAVIFFPPLSAGGTSETETPTPKLLAAVLAAADAASDAAIRIGVSPWGFEGEFAARPTLEQRFHVLLGGGPGAPFPAEVNPQVPGLIWSRADRDGRNVMVIDLMAMPEPGQPFAWEWGLNMRAQEVRLTSEIPSDPHMEAIVSGSSR